jgi:alpha-mannosidase
MTSPFSQLTRPWEIYLVHHTHVDIGFTDPQVAVLPRHADFLASVLDYCSATDNLPPGERFCWTCEVSWTVKNFLRQYPARAEEFFRRVGEGRIEVAGIFLQLTDLLGEKLLEAAADYAANLGREQGFAVVTALNDDVNGWAWGLPKILAERGIRYFDIAINEVRHANVRPRPRPFYWASPGGEKVLVWHGNNYTQGNSLGFDKPGAEARVAAYLQGLEDTGYPHGAVEVRIQGLQDDNAPPGLWLCEMVGQWNQHRDYPRLKLCPARQWFEEIEKHWPEPLATHQAAWPDWWADGNGSALYESALVRSAQAGLDSAEALAAVGGTLDAARRERAQEAAMFFCEHTWGAWCSTDQPDSLESKAQWHFKADFAYRAAMEAKVLVRETLLSCLPAAESGEVQVFNPLPFVRTDLVEVLITDDLIIPDGPPDVPTAQRTEAGPAVELVDLISGEICPAARRPIVADARRKPGQWVRFIAKEVPPQGWKKYRIQPATGQFTPCSRRQDNLLENTFFRLTVDPGAGGITSLVDLAQGRELVAAGNYALNQLIYETIDDPADRERLCSWRGSKTDAPFLRRSPVMQIKSGPLLPFGVSLILEGGGGDLPEVKSEIVLYDDLPRVDIFNTLKKAAHPQGEAIYQAFPIAAESPTVYLDIPGAVFRPGLEQIPGSATDWQGIQHYFAAADNNYTVVVASPDVPLVQINGINTGKWQDGLPPPNGVIMSWVMNNYWFTGFPATQSGRVDYRYSLAGQPGAFLPDAARRFALSIRQPLLAAARRPGGTAIIQGTVLSGGSSPA